MGSKLKELLRNYGKNRKRKTCLKTTGLKTGLNMEKGGRVTNAFNLKMQSDKHAALLEKGFSNFELTIM